MPDTPRGSAAGPTWHGVYHPNGHCPTGECAELHVQAVLDTATTYELQGGALLGEAELRMSEKAGRGCSTHPTSAHRLIGATTAADLTRRTGTIRARVRTVTRSASSTRNRRPKVSEPTPGTAAPLLDPATTFDNQPDGWLVLWCPFCLYAVTWTEPDWATYDDPEWDALRRDASEHACSVEHG